MKDKNMFRRRIISIVLFVIALYFTVFSPFSEGAVATINGGYGTFDMKSYDAKVFVDVMNTTIDFSMYWKYYICDFIFIIAFLNFMVQMVNGFKGKYFDQIRKISYALAIIRGLLDASENVILLSQIYAYPNAKYRLIDVCNRITQIKFHFMRGWILCFVVMVIMQVFLQHRIKKDK